MAYDQDLAARVRAALISLDGFDEKKMFGGLCFLLHGNMACGLVRDLLIVRVGPEGYAAALAQPHAALFDLTGRPMTGWVQVSPAGVKREADLAAWLQRGVDFARSLPPKTAGKKK
ncbi:TfoX/Sxy family protein [Trichloromonas sp.]|uniref:TfoX/Sxy family protein n=1 Tax=Trichloromonas sp. TaxID=3069249 RepID=UPI003D81BFC1